uniref:RING-type domain-containing protein n=1 Tax=Caenorhabditis tropicalis TaxID=1561998 RepID=A0A1I7TRI3_9PELO
MSSTPIDAASIVKQLAEAREKKAMLEDKIKQTQLLINDKMNAIAQIDAKQQKMECAVCLQPFNATRRSPILLHCGHSFCGECIASIVTAKGKNTPLVPSFSHVRRAAIQTRASRTHSGSSNSTNPFTQITVVNDIFIIPRRRELLPELTRLR